MTPPSAPLEGGIDAHCHLDDPTLDAKEMRRLRPTGAEAINPSSARPKDEPQGFVCAGFSPERWPAQKAIQLPNVWHAVGLHPWAEVSWDPATLERELEQGWAVAVGECGLDFARERSPERRAEQKRVLAAHLRLARKAELPVVLHVVRAHQAVLELLDQAGPAAGMVHGFAGPIEQARDFLVRGLYLSIGPFSLRRPEVLRELPSDRILAETDAPGRGAHLADLDTVLQAIAEARGGTAREWAEITADNARRLLKI